MLASHVVRFGVFELDASRANSAATAITRSNSGSLFNTRLPNDRFNL